MNKLGYIVGGVALFTETFRILFAKNILFSDKKKYTNSDICIFNTPERCICLLSSEESCSLQIEANPTLEPREQ